MRYCANWESSVFLILLHLLPFFRLSPFCFLPLSLSLSLSLSPPPSFPLSYTFLFSFSFSLPYLSPSFSSHIRSRGTRFASLLPSHRRISRKSSGVGLGLPGRTAWKDSPNPIAVSVPHSVFPSSLRPLPFLPVSPFSFSWNHFNSIPQLLLPIGSSDCRGIAHHRLSTFGRSSFESFVTTNQSRDAVNSINPAVGNDG